MEIVYRSFDGNIYDDKEECIWHDAVTIFVYLIENRKVIFYDRKNKELQIENAHSFIEQENNICYIYVSDDDAFYKLNHFYHLLENGESLIDEKYAGNRKFVFCYSTYKFIPV